MFRLNTNRRKENFYEWNMEIQMDILENPCLPFCGKEARRPQNKPN